MDNKEYVSHEEWQEILRRSKGDTGYDEKTCYPLSETERGSYLEQMSDPGSTEYNLQIFFHICGAGRQKVEEALHGLLSSHEAFHSYYGSLEGIPIRILSDDIPVIEWTVADSVQEAEKKALSSEKPFDLHAAVPVRVTGYEISEQDILLHFEIHHIAMDAGSHDTITKELFARLKGEEIGSAPLDLSGLAFDDHSKIWEEGLSYFKSVFSDKVPVCEMPVFGSRPALMPASDCSRSMDFDAMRLSLLERAAKAAGCTTFQFIFSAISIVLGRYCGSEDLVMGVPTNIRDEKGRGIVGMFVNMTPVRVKPKPDMLLADYLRQVSDGIVSSAKNVQLPFSHVVREFGTGRDTSRHPIFDVSVNYIYMPPVMSDEEISLEYWHIPQKMKRDMTINIRRREKEMIFSLQYSSLLYEDALIDRFLEHIAETIDAMCTMPDATVGEVGGLPRRQMSELEGLSLSAQADIPQELLHRMLESASDNNPKGTAIVACDQILNFEELNMGANRIAHALIEKGIKKGDSVVLLLPRRSFYFPALFGVLKAGAAFIPCDPDYPADRISHIISDSGAACMIIAEDEISGNPNYAEKVSRLAAGISRGQIGIASLLENDKTENPEVDVTGDDLAYMIYTSGSTGVPKGVMLGHRGISNFCTLHPANILYDAMDKGIRSMLSVTTVSFDLSLKDTLGVLVNGKTVVFASEEQMNDPRALTALIRDNEVEAMNATPSRIMQYLGYAPFEEALKGLKLVAAGGEPYPATLLSRLKELGIPCIINTYGPTETTISSNMARLEGNEITVGRPLLNVREYIVDKNGEIVPRGVTGELLIGGPGVAKGYHGLDAQTAERFIIYKGSRFYRSGDIAKWDEKGNIQIQGRIDGQVKLRGLRIELGEIESVMESFSGIKRAVAAIKNINGQDQLCAYYVSTEPVDETDLRESLSKRLTRYMVPSAFLRLDEIPVTPNGKADLKALPVPEYKAAVIDKTEPETDEQKRVFEIVADIAHTRDFGIRTPFEDIGMTSLTLVALMLKASEEFERDINMSGIRENNTVEKLTELLTGEEEIEDYEKLSEYPLTQTQYGIYVECLNNPGTTIYNIPVIWMLDEGIDTERLKNAVRVAIDAHPYMKARLQERDGKVYVQRDDNIPAQVEETEFDKDIVPEQLIRPFDLTKDELYRAGIYKTPGGNVFYLDMHHIISDGRSRAILQRDIEAVYAGEKIKQESFTGYESALEESRRREGPAYEKARDFYKIYLSDVQITRIAPVPEEGAKKTELKIKTDLEQGKLADIFEKCHITGNVFFNAVFGYVMGVFAGTEDTVFTTIYDGRNDSRVRNTVSMLVKTLPVRCSWTGETKVEDYLVSVRDGISRSMDSDSYSFAEVVGEYGINADFMVAWQDEMAIAPEFCGAPAKILRPVSDTSKCDLSVDVSVEDGNIVFMAEHRPEIYGSAFVRSFLECMSQVVLEFTIRQTLGEVCPVSETTENALRNLHDTDWPIKERPAYRLLQDSAAKWPDRIAVISKGEKLTYAELNKRANRLGYKLRKMGLGTDKLCALLLHRSAQVYVARQGILKAGGAFLSIDPEYPDERISFILEDAGCSLIITDKALYEERKEVFDRPDLQVCFVEDAMDASLSTENHNIPVPFDALAYSIYTSGSTGKPKGVLLTQRNLVSFVDDNPKNKEILGYTERGKVSLALASVSFDVSVMEEFIPLAHGLTIVMADDDERHDHMALSKLCLDNNVDIITCTPSMLSNLLDMPENRPMIERIKTIDIGAEAFPAALYDRIRNWNQDVYIMNGYGPTEATISCTMAVMDGTGDVTIGTPGSNVKVVMTDSRGHILPICALGEMVIIGEGVGRGYQNREDLTQKSFIRMWDRPAYRSGDLARLLPDGNIDLRGRIDNQVKLRGLRVELDEIENVMMSMSGVLLAKVIVRNNGKEDYLAGFYTEDAGISEDALRSFMKEQLAPYMVPDVLVRIDDMPLTTNGKIDKNKLPNVTFKRTATEYVAPETDEEKAFCECFGEILGLERVSATDSFFEIGGTSLSAMRVVSFATNKGWNLVYRNVFDHTTPRELAAFVTAGAKESSQSEPELVIGVEDFEALSGNMTGELDGIASGTCGKVLLTGATGFLGIHVLKELLTSDKADDITCLIRPGKRQSAEKRLKTLLEYYFDDTFDDAFTDRLRIVMADITDEDLSEKLKGCDFDTIFNCAAVVRHFAKDDIIERVNYHGVRNLIEIALEKNARLIQVSTESVGGQSVNGSVPPDRWFTERDLAIGQTLATRYAKSKFLAEKDILTAISERGLKAKILRVGNLMSRRSDGEFQINFATNAFMSRLKAYVVLGCFPVDDLDSPVEFSPIDSVAAALVLLSGTQDKYTVFHADNCHVVHMANILEALDRCGMKLEVVSQQDFSERLRAMQTDPKYSLEVSSLLSYSTNDNAVHSYINVSNSFTVKALYRLGFSWPVITPEYIERAIKALAGLGLFDV